MSADSWTVGGSGTGGYNRYAYAGNNPVTFTDPSGRSFIEYAFQMARGPLAAAGELTATGVLFSAVFGAAAGGVAYAVFGPEPKTAEGALTWMLIGGIDGVCGAVTKNAFLCGALNGALFQAADDWLVNHQLSSWWDYAKAASLNGLLGVGAGWAGYGLSKVTKPAWTWLKKILLGKATGGASAAERVAVNGETPATKLGREMHKAWEYGPGFEKEFTLPSGRRVDAINFVTREVIELKPNNPRAIQSGERQLAVYIEELNQAYPGDVPWTGSVVTYGAP